MKAELKKGFEKPALRHSKHQQNPLESFENHILVAFSKPSKVLLFFIALTAVMIAPALRDPIGLVPGTSGDGSVFTFSIWWYGQKGLDFLSEPRVSDIFYPYGVPYQVYGDFAPINIFLYPVIKISPLLAYNLSVFLSFVLSGFFTYLLVRDLTKDNTAGAMSGIFFAFTAYRFIRYSGHLNLVHTEWFPLLIYAAKKLLDTKDYKYAALSGVSFSLMFLSSGYYAYIGALAVVSFAFLYLRTTKLALPPLRTLAVAVLIPLVVLSPFLYYTSMLRGEGELTGSLGLAYFHSADFLKYIWYNPRGLLMSDAVLGVPIKTSIFTEQALYLGFVPLLLAAFLVLKINKEKKDSLWKYAKIFIILGAAFFVLSLGPFLKWVDGGMITIPLPDSAKSAILLASEKFAASSFLSQKDVDRVKEFKEIPVPMPYLALYFTLPFFSMMRVPSRFGIIVYLSLAVIAGIGVSRSGPKIRKWLPLLAVVYLLEVVPLPPPMFAPQQRAVDAWLAQQPGVAIVEYPVTLYDCTYLDHIQFHGKKIANICASFLPKNAVSIIDMLKDFPPSKEALDYFRKNGIAYILVDTSQVNATNVPLKQLGKFDNVIVYSTAVS